MGSISAAIIIKFVIKKYKCQILKKNQFVGKTTVMKQRLLYFMLSGIPRVTPKPVTPDKSCEFFLE